MPDDTNAAQLPATAKGNLRAGNSSAADGAENPKFGTLKGKIVINDPDWWKPMSDEEVDAFLASGDSR
jgi:hypothetical protein